MTENNLAEKPENYDITAEVKASAVMTETEVQETVTLNVNDSNIQEGPQTPPKGKVEDKETANGDVSNVTPLTFAEVAKAKQLSPERLKEIIDAAENDNLFPTEKLNGQNLIEKVNVLRDWVDKEESHLKAFPFSIGFYKRRKAVLQARAAYVLIIECYIGEQLKAIPKLKGTNKNSKCRVSGQMRTKTQIIQEDYELSSRQSRDFQHLTWDGVKAAIEIALRRNDIPTRDLYSFLLKLLNDFVMSCLKTNVKQIFKIFFIAISIC